MKALLICPGRRPAVALLAESGPLAVAPLLGKSLVEYWIEHLAGLGVREILILASDRIAQVRARVGDGTRWGLAIAVTAEAAELSIAQASEKYPAALDSAPELVVAMDHLPGLPIVHLLESYAAWFAGIQAWMPRAQALERIGHCEVQPGVWVGLRARIDPAAQLLAPCWLGDYVSVNGDAVIGPGAILEDGVVVSPGAGVTQSIVGPATFVGGQIRVEHSIAHRDTVIDWQTDSCLRVPDAFWLSSLSEPLSARRRQAKPGPMRIAHGGGRLRVTRLEELSAANSNQFLEAVHAAFSPAIAVIEVDLSHTRFVDCCGLATLCGLRQSTGALGISLQLLNPEPTVRQLLDLTQMNRFFNLGPAEPSAAPAPRSAVARFTPASAFVLAY
jgi:anti-anti-sigma factor